MAAPLILPVWRSSAAVAGGRIYVFGGYQFQSVRNFPFNPTNRVFEYNPLLDAWTEVAPMPTMRGSLAAVTIDGEIHVVGGANNSAQSVHEIYNPATNQWRTGQPMTTSRSGLTAEVVDGKLYAIGGYTLSGGSVLRRTTAEVYDPAQDIWSLIANPPQARLGIDAASMGGKLIVIGGADTPASRTILYDPVQDSWRQLPDMPVPVNFMGVTHVGNTIVAAGGGPQNLNEFDAVANTRVLAVSGLFAINAGLNDAWFNPQTPGQGFFLTVFEDIGMVFLAWFTYDTVRPAGSVIANLGEPGHRWITAFGPFNGDTAELDVEITSGGVFDSAQPGVDQAIDGAITLQFTGCNAGMVTYSIASLGLLGEVPIQRIALDNVSRCEMN
jgi:hypothetical protein